jgi:hypothetical protein
MIHEEFDQVSLRTVGVQAHLVHDWQSAGIAQDVSEELSVEVWDTDTSGKAEVNKMLHTAVKSVHGDRLAAEEVVGPVDVVDINVVELEGFQALSESCLRVGVVRVPQLGSHEKVVSLDWALFHSSFDAFSDVSLIHGDLSSVDVAVSHLADGPLDTLGVLMEEGTKTHNWHLSAVGESD